MYWVLVDRRGGRVLVTGRPSDVDELKDLGWDVEYEAERWDEAYEVALLLADEEDYVVEWYLEEEVGEKKRRLASLENI